MPQAGAREGPRDAGRRPGRLCRRRECGSRQRRGGADRGRLRTAALHHRDGRSAVTRGAKALGGMP